MLYQFPFILMVNSRHVKKTQFINKKIPRSQKKRKKKSRKKKKKKQALKWCKYELKREMNFIYLSREEEIGLEIHCSEISELFC